MTFSEIATTSDEVKIELTEKGKQEYKDFSDNGKINGYLPETYDTYCKKNTSYIDVVTEKNITLIIPAIFIKKMVIQIMTKKKILKEQSNQYRAIN